MSRCKYCGRTEQQTGGQERCEKGPQGVHRFGLLHHYRKTLTRHHFTWHHIKGQLKLSWLRLRMWYAYVWHNPAPRPEQIGTDAAKGRRPITLGFVFTLHPDGSVYMKSRFGGQELVEEEALIGLVHREYRLIVRREYAKRGLKPPKENP